MVERNEKTFAVILPAGGARAAYQIGILNYISKNFPQFQPRIFCGISAGSINACYLAQGDNFADAVPKLYELWGKLRFNQVLNNNFRSILTMGLRWLYDSYVSKLTKRLLLLSLLDASPLAVTLLTYANFWKISQAIKTNRIRGLAITATNYNDGSTTVFYDCSEPIIEPWYRQYRSAIRTTIKIKHVMASCSIPILFQPVRIGNYYYGDGALRYNFPFSPAIHLGATHILAISNRAKSPGSTNVPKSGKIGIGFVAGTVLNSIFLDSLEQDYETLLRMNNFANNTTIRTVKPLLIQPSMDLGLVARDFVKEVPLRLRQLLLSTTDPSEIGDLLSYLMFNASYEKALMKLGEQDAAKFHGEIEKFLE